MGPAGRLCRKPRSCVSSQTHYSVEIEHFLLSLLDGAGTDVIRALGWYDVDTASVNRQLTETIAKFKRGNTRTPALSPQITTLLEDAWVACSPAPQRALDPFGARSFRPLLDDDTRRGMIYEGRPFADARSP